MEHKYSNERAVQLLISLLKQHNIKRIVASPGATNITFIGSAMQDSWFEIYSSVDERSAAYIACGLADETHEPVVLTCTGATASRNYMPGLTEAYYRKLPVLAVTASQDFDKIGHLSPQLIDRSNVPNDIAKRSFTVKAVRNADDEWADEIAINNALLELTRNGGGPVHINFQTTYSRDFSVSEFKPARKIDRITSSSTNWPILNAKRVAFFIGSHSQFDASTTELFDSFCKEYNAVVFCDHTSNYYGKFQARMSLVFDQADCQSDLANIDLLIHLGEVSGDYPTMSISPKEVWRVSEDGEIRDRFKKLTKVFEMTPAQFLSHYCHDKEGITTFIKECDKEYEETFNEIPELPFSNGWIAQQTAHRLPINSVVHLGILNSLRNWNYFRFPAGVRSNCNVGGFGIDGIVSTLLGASLANPNKLYFGILGDLAFFYDMNSIGNRHVGPNLRLMVINNGKGTEFRNYNHPGAAFGDEADLFVAAGGHYGRKSGALLRHYAEDLGFTYLSASGKEEYLAAVEKFLSPNPTDKPILFEVFTDSVDESDALYMLQHLREDARGKAKNIVKKVMGETGTKVLKNILGR